MTTLAETVAALEMALEAGPTLGDWKAESYTLFSLTGQGRREVNRFVAQFQSACQQHEAQTPELQANAQFCAAANPAALRLLLDALKTRTEALQLARDELASLPKSLGYEFTHLLKIEAALRDPASTKEQA